MGGDGGCRVGEVRASTTSPMPDHKGFKLQEQVNFQKFSTLRVKIMKSVYNVRPLIVSSLLKLLPLYNPCTPPEGIDYTCGPQERTLRC